MPMHDWTLVPDGIYHAFHQRWIAAISDRLNAGILPNNLYALPEQIAAGFSPDVLTLQTDRPDDEDTFQAKGEGGVATAPILQTRPKTRFTAETDAEHYRRKKSAIAIRHVSGDRIVALIEIVSPGNKSGKYQIESFVRKACEFLERRVHLLILDPFPPGPRDPDGVHALIWQELDPVPFQLPADKPLTLVAYECELGTRAYIEPVAVGDSLPDMPLFLAPNGCVMVPLESTYQTAFEVQPRRWRAVLQGPVSDANKDKTP
jgi:hypothetical protein